MPLIQLISKKKNSQNKKTLKSSDLIQEEKKAQQKWTYQRINNEANKNLRNWISRETYERTSNN